jgi:phage protein D
MQQPTPDFSVTLDGQNLSTKIAPRLISLTISECRTDEADQLDLVLDDSDGRLALPKKGAVLAVSMGWTGQALVDKGTFTVDEVEHSGAPDTITVRARSASMTKNMGERQEKSWHGQTLGAIVRAIAGKHKLKPTISDTLGKLTIPHIDQTHESDMAFLTRLAKRYDAVMTVKETRLLFLPIGAGVTASGKPLPVVTIERSTGDQHRYSVRDRENFECVRAYWHSGKKGKRQTVYFGSATARSFKTLPEIYSTAGEATAAAKSELQRIERGQATLGYTLALGRPEIRPELTVNVRGFKPEIDGTDWLVSRATHTISDGGLQTSLELERGGASEQAIS